MGLKRYVRKVRKEVQRTGRRLDSPEDWLAAGLTGGASIGVAGVNRPVTDTLGGPSPWNDRPMPSSMNPQDVQWDPNTLMPNIDGPPTQDKALAYQQYAERLAAQKQERLFGDASGQYRTAESYFQTYRPGAAMALASGLHRDQANLYLQRGAMVEAPDLLAGYREHQASLAAREAKRAARMQMAMGIFQAGASLLGGSGLLRPGSGGSDSAGGTGAAWSQEGSFGTPSDSAGGQPMAAQSGDYGPQTSGYDQGAAPGSDFGGQETGGGFAGGGDFPGGQQEGQGGSQERAGQSQGGGAMAAGLGTPGGSGGAAGGPSAGSGGKPSAGGGMGSPTDAIAQQMVTLEYADMVNDGQMEVLEGIQSRLLAQTIAIARSI